MINDESLLEKQIYNKKPISSYLFNEDLSEDFFREQVKIQQFYMPKEQLHYGDPNSVSSTNYLNELKTKHPMVIARMSYELLDNQLVDLTTKEFERGLYNMNHVIFPYIEQATSSDLVPLQVMLMDLYLYLS